MAQKKRKTTVRKQRTLPARTEFAQLTEALVDGDASWHARQSHITDMPVEQRKRMLGVVVDRGALDRAMARPRSARAVTANFAALVDWRNYRNGNHVTPIKDQGGCGSCVSFCTAALVEAMAHIERGVTLDLSEADLHFCSSHGPSCDGWWPDTALEEARVRGIPDDASFPYASAFGPDGVPRCVTAADRDVRAVRISNHGTIVDVVERKNHLTHVGPCSAVFEVFTDFYGYGGGVYRHVWGESEGLHCVEVIGFSEPEQCWICKNSWGVGWGEAGYFRIGYGECDIDTSFPFSTATGVRLPIDRVTGAIRQKYEALGAEKGFLGYPLTDELRSLDRVGRYIHFQGGSIYWSPTSDARAVYGGIRDKWNALMAERGVLRYPVTDELGSPDGVGRFVHFQRGSIYWTPRSGARMITGAIRDKWAGLGWERGFLGYPITDEMAALGAGRFNHFQGGSIYWSPATGAHVVYGGIRDKWAAQGWERGKLGFPTSDEESASDGVGRFSNFQNGSIYWSPSSGAQVLGGPILRKWRALGAERSALGYPVSSEVVRQSNPLIRACVFQGGTILAYGLLGTRIEVIPN